MSLQLAEQFEANEQYEDAYREYMGAFEADPNNIGLLERLGHIAMILGKYDDAASYYNEILRRDVTNPLAYEQLMSIYEGTDKYKYYVLFHHNSYYKMCIYLNNGGCTEIPIGELLCFERKKLINFLKHFVPVKYYFSLLSLTRECCYLFWGLALIYIIYIQIKYHFNS